MTMSTIINEITSNSKNSDTNGSELLENLELMYYMGSYICNTFLYITCTVMYVSNSLTHNSVLPVSKGLRLWSHD